MRVQVVVKSVYIYDDQDWHSSGDIWMMAHLYRCPDEPKPCLPEENTKVLTMHEHSFGGSTGQSVTLNRVLPRAADAQWGGYDLSEDAGYPLYAGERYILRFKVWDKDNGYGHQNDYMGHVDVPLAEENGYYLGTHHVDASKDGAASGDFSLNYEVIVTQLPNLLPFSLERFEIPGSSDVLACVGVSNAGAEPAGPFKVVIQLDSGIARNGIIDVGGLGVGQINTLCTTTSLPSNGHSWGAFVDRDHQVPEMNERDNSLIKLLALGPNATSPKDIATDSGADATPVASPTASPPPASPTGTPTPTTAAGKADLVIGAIKVNGRVPDGRDDCKDGKSDVVVVVTNQGARKAGDFVVRLVVDDAQGAALEQGLDAGLDAGKEVPVTFAGVRLKEGLHSLTATADPTTGIAESDDGNNERKVTARCKDKD